MKNLNLNLHFFFLFFFHESLSDHLIKSDKFESFFVKTALSKDEKSKGLMNVKSLDDSTGMIFIYKIPTKVNFWMHKTSLNLDIIFIDKYKKISSIKIGRPFSNEIISSEIPVIAVLEIPYNCSSKLGLKIGMLIEWIPFESVQNKKKGNLCKKL